MQPASLMAAGLWLQAKADACVGVCISARLRRIKRASATNTKLGPWRAHTHAHTHTLVGAYAGRLRRTKQSTVGQALDADWTSQ